MRYDLCAPRQKKDGGTYWHKVGAMFPSDKGGFSIMLDSLPLPDKDGRLVVKAFEPRDNNQGGYSKPANGGAPASGDDEDSIPFFPEFR